jgi:RNA polymerase sigma factor (sigma-70 family)
MGAMKWEVIEKWDYIVSHVADEYAKKYTMLDRDDIKQALYQWFVEHPNKTNEYGKLKQNEAQNVFYRVLRNQALDYCQFWRARSIGYESSDLFYYDPDVVEALLPTVLLGTGAEAPKLNLGMPGRPPAPSEGGNMMAMVVEIKAAFTKLSQEDRNILYLKYAHSLTHAGVAEELGLSSDDAARMRHNRAIKKLIIRLGGYRPFLETDNQFEEDGNSSDDSKSDAKQDEHSDYIILDEPFLSPPE